MIALIGLHVTPFGDHALVISDANGLYINYLAYAGRMLEGKEGILYSFKKGLGGNMMPHFCGALTNPFYFLFTLSQTADYPQAFTWVSTCNLSLCGLAMYTLLADLYGHKKSNLIFSTSYALMGFNVANVFQSTFFNGLYILPIMALGLRKIFQRKSPLLYILSIAYIMFLNAYFGYVICAASLLFFLLFLWEKSPELEGSRLSVIGNYAVSSLIGGLLPIAVWLPAFLSMRGGRLDQTSIRNFSFRENMPIPEIGAKLFTGANNTSELVDGLPNIFVGLLPVALTVLFFLNKRIEKRKKTAAGLALGFFILSFYIVAFDMVMHGGTTTNWFNYRYSYVFSFVLLMLAAYEWQYIETVPTEDLRRCGVGMALAAVFIFSKRYGFVTGGEVLLDFGLLLLICLAYRMYRLKPQFNPLHTFETVALLVVCVSLLLNYVICTKNIQEWETKESDYRKTVLAVEPLLSGIQLADSDFYRAEVNKQRSNTCGNDPMLYGYNGVGHGGSVERNFVREELSKLGVQWYDMRNYYAQGIPAATDALLGIRYLIADEDMTEEKGYTRMTDMRALGLDGGDDEVYDAYRNPFALPVAFAAEAGVNDLELNRDDLFDNLNRVWAAISGEDRPVFTEVDDIRFRTVNLSDTKELDAAEAREIVRSYESKSQEDAASDTDAASDGGSDSGADSVKETGIITDEEPEFSSSVEFCFTAQQDGPVYVYHRAAMSDIYGSVEPVLKYMGYFRKGETVTGYLPVRGDYVNRITFEEFAGRFRAACADLDALQALSGTVQARPSTVEKLKDGHLRGSVTLEEGQELLFTIPWDAGWTCTVDGEKAELTKVLGIFMAVQAAPGEHSYEMKFVPVGMRLGLEVSAAAFALLLLYLAVGRKWLDWAPGKKRETCEHLVGRKQ